MMFPCGPDGGNAKAPRTNAMGIAQGRISDADHRAALATGMREVMGQ